MPTPYSRTLRSLDADAPSGWVVAILVVALLFGFWTSWMFLAKIGVYTASLEGRIQSSSGPHAVEAEVQGRVTKSHVTIGQAVEEGDLLLEMDPADSQLLLHEARDRAETLAEELEGVERQLRAEEESAAEARAAAAAELEEARARLQEAEALVELSDAEAERAQDLYESGLLSAAERQRATSEAKQRSWAALAQQLAVVRLERSNRAQENSRVARNEGLRAELTSLRGELNRTQSEIERVKLGLARLEIRAPVAGVVGGWDLFTPGTVVEAGQRVATIVPEASFKIIADFDPAHTIGRIRPGQQAVVRLDGFPWTQFGTLLAKVTTVSSEPRDGKVQVELEPLASTGVGPPLAHGSPARVEVEVERVSPAVLILRAAGGRFDRLRSERDASR